MLEKTLCLGKECSHDNIGSSCFHRADECGRRKACSINVINNQNLPAFEEVRIYMYAVLYISSQFVVLGFVCSFTASDDFHIVESVLCTGKVAKHLREPFPAAHMCTFGACRDAHDGNVREVNSAKCISELTGSPFAIDIPAIFETKDHSACVFLLEGCASHEPLWQIVVYGELHHGRRIEGLI